MNEARLREITTNVEDLRTLEGKEFLKKIICITNDAQLTDLLAGHREFNWVFKKIENICNTVPKESRNQWLKEIQEEVGREDA